MFKNIPLPAFLLLTAIAAAAEESTFAAGAPAGWSRISTHPTVLRGPGTDSAAPRLALTSPGADPDSAAATMRAAWLRMTDGGEIVADETIQLGGQGWRRIRVRFATGPLAFAQCAWIGAVAGRTQVAVLSAPDDALDEHLAACQRYLADAAAR